ncbi:glycosyltransferase [Clostridium sp. CMCC3677]|uniref:glycosyltransferase family 2 protein n=1 Tax=Clostridium sp. CMCC3677 TaxID=2949963 RepID=UPI0013F1397B|nr:glycosyltransferase [Clostridium sp. CMCC3677]NFG60722.1 glycosyltransferase [Clostridium botulinum]NFQ08156.1 glycosyltransferase [Clostridium botulinum]
MKLVSVIVPIYKVEKYLIRCVESIQKQTYKNLEIILVDDGSPDSCGKMCDELAEKDKRIKVIHKVNGGLSDARNVGIEVAKGEYLVFVDSDDWLDLDMIELLYNLCEQRDAEIAECSYRNLYMDGIIEETRCTAEIIEADSLLALEGMLDWKYFKPVAWNKLYKKSVFKDVRYPKGKIHEDEFTTYKYIYNANKIVYVDVSKYNYDRRRVDSITGEDFREANLYASLAFRERLDFFKEHNIKSLQNKMINIYCWHALEALYNCYLNNISGKLVDQVKNLLLSDFEWIKKEDVNEEYIRRIIILKHGLAEYGEYRDTNIIKEKWGISECKK